MHARRLLAGAATIGIVTASVVLALLLSSGPPAVAQGGVGIAKIQHVIVIMQENRSFDHYFGTYPGADGFPVGTCVRDPAGSCALPYHDSSDRNAGSSHRA